VLSSALINPVKSSSLEKTNKQSKSFLFDMLYEERKLIEKSREDSIAHYRMKPSFQPDIRVAHHTVVENNVEEFSQRFVFGLSSDSL
jgi:hypothetical protein